MPLNETSCICDTCTPATAKAAAKLIVEQAEIIRRLSKYFDVMLLDNLRHRGRVAERNLPGAYETFEMTRELECEAKVHRARVDLARSLFEHALNEAVFLKGESMHDKAWAHVEAQFAEKAARS